MQTVERLSSTLPTAMARTARAKVQEGRYATTSELIRDALRARQEREERHGARLAAVGATIQELRDDPPPARTEEEVGEHGRAMSARDGDLRDTDA